MRTPPWPDLEPYRVTTGPFGSARGFPGGAFRVPLPSAQLVVLVASAGLGPVDSAPGLRNWDHVSVSVIDRCPTWGEMEQVRRLFFRPEETVVQFHPPLADYRNQDPYVLHMWRHATKAFPRPPGLAVGAVESIGLTDEEAIQRREELSARAEQAVRRAAAAG
jgi:hypothetical protein